MSEENAVETVEADVENVCKGALAKASSKKYQDGEPLNVEILLGEEALFSRVESYIEIKEVILSPIDPGLTVSWSSEEKKIGITGTPSFYGERYLDITYWATNRDKKQEIRHFTFFCFRVNPDPKKMWNVIEPSVDEPYQAPHVVTDFKELDGKIVVGVSKRGRSHAHTGKFRDDNFKTAVFPETGWLAVVVSDGAGSAKYSREGSRITCEAILECVTPTLSSIETNKKLDSMEKDARDALLKGYINGAAFKSLEKISEEVNRRVQEEPGCTRRDFHATMLVYLMRKMEKGWLIVSMGVGDGIMAVLGLDNTLTLLSEPDSGEFVGQTRFITMNEVWTESPENRVRIIEMPDFRAIFSMTDGVSDPMFETDNDLKSQEKWLDFEKQIDSCLTPHDETSKEKLCEWLDFWSKGNHDDRTIVVVY